MSTIREEFFTALTKGAKWDVGVSINRTNPLPLDVYSVFNTEDALNAYVSGKFSYPGQVLALIKEDETIIYYLDQNKTLQEVGGKIEVDGKSVQLNDEGKLEIVGFTSDDAKALTLPQKQADGTIKWVGIDSIVEGDGNTTYKFTLTDTKTGFVVTPVNAGVEDTDGAVTVGFDVYTTVEVDEMIKAISDEIGVASQPESSEGAGDAVEASGLYKLIENKADKTITDDLANRITANENAITTIMDGIDSDKIDSLTELIDWADEHAGEVKTIEEGISANAQAIETLNGDSTVEGSVDKKIADLSGTVDSTYAKKDYVGNIPDEYEETTVIAYVNKKAEESISEVRGETTETVASIKQQLDDYKTNNDNTVNGHTSSIESIVEKLDGIAEGAQVNVIEEVIAKEGSKITATTDGKTVTIDDSVLVNLINSAQSKANEADGKADAAQGTANEAKGAAEANAGEIQTLKETTIPGVKAIADKNASDIASLTTKVAIEEGKVGTLESIVAGKAESSTVNALAEQVGAIDGGVTGLTTRVAANESAITSINETLADKANSSNVYTKAETDAIIGTPAEGKTIVQMISDAQAAATYDDTDIKADIAANAAAITKLNADDKTEGSVDYKVAQEVAKILNDNDASDIDTLNEIASWIVNDTTGAAKMNADISANAAAITKLNGDANTEGSVLSLIKENAPNISTVDNAGIVKSVASTVENGVSVAEDGTMSVNSVNVNKLVQTEGEFLILNGGNANIPSETV